MNASAAAPLHLNGEYFGPVEADMANQIISDSRRVCAIDGHVQLVQSWSS